MTSFPTTLVPDDISAVTTKLGDLSKSHTDHHQAVDERLGELQAALGKIDTTGFVPPGGDPLPTLFDPASTVFTDGPWRAFRYAKAGFDVYHEEWFSGLDGHQYVRLHAEQGAGGGTRFTGYTVQAESDSTANYEQFDVNTSINVDGTGRSSSVTFQGDSAAAWLLTHTATRMTQTIYAETAQTAALLELVDNGGNDVLAVMGNAKIGLFGATAQSQGAAIADSTAVTVSARFNDLLAYLRLRGDIAT